MAVSEFLNILRDPVAFAAVLFQMFADLLRLFPGIDDLMCGGNGDPGNPVDRKLAERVKGTDGVHLITEQFNPVRLVSGQGIDVHQSAANSKLPPALHRFGTAVAGKGSACR